MTPYYVFATSMTIIHAITQVVTPKDGKITLQRTDEALLRLFCVAKFLVSLCPLFNGLKPYVQVNIFVSHIGTTLLLSKG